MINYVIEKKYFFDENILWELNKKKKQCQKLNHLLNDKRKMPR